MYLQVTSQSLSETQECENKSLPHHTTSHNGYVELEQVFYLHTHWFFLIHSHFRYKNYDKNVLNYTHKTRVFFKKNYIYYRKRAKSE
jgi:hypothetical protein